MNNEETQSAVGCLFFLSIIFIILAVFNAFGEQVRSIMLILMSILAVGMVAAVCYKAIKQL